MKKINMPTTKHYFFVAILISLSACMPYYSYGQDIYADQMMDHSTDFQQAPQITDADHTNYGYVSNLLNLLSTSYIKVGFPVTGKAGDVVNVTVKGTGQAIGAGLLNATTIKLYDSVGNLKKSISGTNVLQLSLLAPGTDIYSIRFATDIADDYTFKSVRIEFNNLLTLNVLNDFRVYSVFFQQSCPPVFADAVHSFKSGGLLTSSVQDPSNAVSASQNDFAKMIVPLNLLGLLPPAYLDLDFSSKGRAGEYVGFTIGEASSVLDLSLLQNLNIKVYDDNDILRDSMDGFTVLDLKLLPGTGNKYSIGFITQSGNYNIAHIKITLDATLALLEDLDVYNAFHYEIDRPPVTISVNGPTTICEGGQVVLTANDAMGSTDYHWNTGATTQSITVTQTGTYFVEVTDSISCSRYSIPIKITVAPNPSPLITGDTVLCHGATGALGLQDSYASYHWSDNSTDSSLAVSVPGIYYVAVTTSFGCIGSDTVQVEKNELSVVPTITATNCNNTNSGSVSLNVSGGSGQYTYEWSNGGTASSIGNLKPGLYVSTITDNVYGCSYNKSFTVAANHTLSLKSSVIKTSGCGATDGSITESVIGGSGQYNYSWSTNATTAGINGLSAGRYVVTVTDQGSGCTATDTIWLGDGNSPLVIHSTVTPMSSCNTANGKIHLNISGGSGSYSYLWSNNSTTASINGLSAGIYTVLVHDNNTGCYQTASITVPHSTALAVSGTVSPASCTGSNGDIAATVSGGSGNYTYHWSNGMTTATIHDLQAGTYILNVSDNSSGCTGQKIFTVKEAGIPSVSLQVTDPACSSNSNGAIALSLTGNHYIYNWSNGSTTKNLTNLNAGDYVVTITDTVTGCSAVYEATLKAKAQIDLVATVSSNTACLSAANGTVEIQVDGGQSPYTYDWSNNATTKNIAGLSPGTYTLTVADANGCLATIATPVATDSSKLLAVAEDSIHNATCNTATNGKAIVQVSGGTAPYTYHWSNGATTKNLSGVVPGSYDLTVTDAIGCTAQLSVTVGMDTSNQLMLTVDSVINATCADTLSGKIYVTTNGGQTPYDYVWSNGNTTEDLLNVAAGNYSLEVTDNIGCTATVSADIQTPSPLVIDGTVQDITCNGADDGAVSLTVNDGSGNYTYSWNNSSTNADISGLNAGTYNVTVTDIVTGCTQTASFTITEPEVLSVMATVVNDTCTTEAFDGMITLEVSGGTAPYNYEWSNAGTTAELTGLRPGIYSVTVKDQHECTANWSGEVNTTDCDFTLDIYNVITPNGDGANDTWVIKGLEYYPNNEVTVFDKWGDKVFQQSHYDGSWSGTRGSIHGTPLPDGTYFYLIKLNAANKQGGKDVFTGSMLLQR